MVNVLLKLSKLCLGLYLIFAFPRVESHLKSPPLKGRNIRESILPQGDVTYV